MAFDLSSITRTKQRTPVKMVVYGPSKVGKSTFAASAPRAIGIRTEDGLSGIEGDAFPLAENLEQVYEAIRTLIREPHEFQSVYVDSLDWLEPLIYAAVCARNSWKSIEEPGYGKGYVAAETEFREFLDGMDALRTKRNMAVILIAHDKLRVVKSPTSDDWSQHALKLHDRHVALVTEWADVIGFAAHDIVLNQKKGSKEAKDTKAIATGRRQLHLDSNPAYVAGNRFSLPSPLPLNWPAFQKALYGDAPAVEAKPEAVAPTMTVNDPRITDEEFSAQQDAMEEDDIAF